MDILRARSADGLAGEHARWKRWLEALLAFLFTLGSAASAGAQARTAPPTLDELLAAIRIVESGHRPDGGRGATGDGGRAIGPYQVHRAHWLDARMPGRFEDCRDPVYARREVVAYWLRWCPDALAHVDAEVLARVHNGGPRGACKESTLVYWHKVRAQLEVERARVRQLTRIAAVR